MKDLAPKSTTLRGESAQVATSRRRSVVLGSIPGLERLLPGHYAPGDTVRSRYGKWTLPRSFRGRTISAIVNGTMFGVA
ncbi:MAG: hypothetical protein WBR13_06765 [Allosphingosinicella sp.]